MLLKTPNEGRADTRRKKKFLQNKIFTICYPSEICYMYNADSPKDKETAGNYWGIFPRWPFGPISRSKWLRSMLKMYLKIRECFFFQQKKRQTFLLPRPFKWTLKIQYRPPSKKKWHLVTWKRFALHSKNKYLTSRHHSRFYL